MNNFSSAALAMYNGNVNGLDSQEVKMRMGCVKTPRRACHSRTGR